MGTKFCRAGKAVRPQEKEDGNSKEIRQSEGEINVGEGAEEEGDMEVEEETAKVKIMRKPEDPTQEEFDTHMVTHMPFRAWCPHCVKGRAKAGPHRKLGKREICEIPTIGMDYTYMKSRADREGEQEQEEEGPERERKTGRCLYW